MNIEDHEFQDVSVASAELVNNIYIEIDVDDFGALIFDREDIIALAKAIELTGEDLK